MLERSVYEAAFAKINLHLRVGKKRTDGFHSIESVFQSISIADVLQLRTAAAFSVKCLNFALPSENSLKKAYTVFCKATGFNKGVEVLLLKRIPACAGLGGASTDAVALLRALQRLSGIQLSEAECARLALEVGSDCPFFVRGGAAFVTGRGEMIKPLTAKQAIGLLIFPKTESKTTEAYALLDMERAKRSAECTATTVAPPEADALCAVYEKWDVCKENPHFVNDFEHIMTQRLPEVREARSALLEAGAGFVRMTGSGSAVFGLFESEKTLQAAIKTLKMRFRFCEPFLFC